MSQRSPSPGSAERRDWPLVSVVMPVRNEASFIRACVEGVLNQDYPSERLEVIVADGMSDDGTRETLSALRADHANLRVIDNPERIVPTGLNRAIRHARGEVIIRVDGHCELDPTFVRESVRVLEEHPEAWSVGGPIVHAAHGPMGKAIALAMSHVLGVGNATHRFPDFEGYVEGAQFPTLPRWVFDRVGWFDEQLVRNQDDEFNYRINQAGGKVFISPRIRFRYYVREKIGQLFRQYFQYGFWRIPVMKKHQRPTTPRQLVPPLFFAVVLALLFCGILMGNLVVAAALPLLYVGALALVGLFTSVREGLPVGIRLPAAIAVMHVGYAWGLVYGAWSSLFNRDAWTSAGRHAALSR